MSTASPKAYLRTKVMTASPAELRLMLLDGAIRFAEKARAAYSERAIESGFEAASRCQAILTELLCGLRHDRDPDLCGKLAALYTFLHRRVVEATSARDPAIFDEVLRLLRFDRETWCLLMEGLARDSKDAAMRVHPTSGAGSESPGTLSLKG